MTHTPVAPFVHVEDNNGKPIVGAVLKIYQPGTTTYRDIFFDSALTVPAANPLDGLYASNAAGNFPRFYTAQGTYKLRAETSVGVLIWEFDNIDTGLSAGVGALPISAGGTGATTAAAARANLDVPSNSELADIASDIVTLSSSVQNIVSSPQGRLTLTANTPVLSVGVIGATAVNYTQYIGNLVPVYDGTQFNARAFASDLVLTLNANHVANAIYDAFIFWDGTSLQIGSGVAWNTATAGAGARGSGAGTTELTRVNGLWVNKYDIAYRNGATTGTITANQGTFVGSFFMDGTNGQVTCHTVFGQSRKWGVWNAYNREPIVLKAGDSAGQWTYNLATIRPSNNSTANSLTVFCGLPFNGTKLGFDQTVSGTSGTISNSGSTAWRTGIGWNSVTAMSGMLASGGLIFTAASSSFATTLTSSARYVVPPTLGINVATALEQTTSLGGGSGALVNYIGTEASMLLSAEWMG